MTGGFRGNHQWPLNFVMESVIHSIITDAKTLKENKTKIIELLLEERNDKGILLEYVSDNSGDNPLLAAIEEGLVDVVKVLVKNGANLFVRNKFDGTSAIEKAAEFGRREIFQFLIEHLPQGGELRESTLVAACSNGDQADIDIVKQLLEMKLDINTRDQRGWTAIMKAAWRGRLDIFNLLLKNGADINLRNDDDWGPLDLAVQGYCQNPRLQLEIASFLIDHGCDINHQSIVEKGQTSFIYVSFMCSPELAKWVIENGGDINIKDRNEETPLFSVIVSKNTVTAQVLLENGAEINYLNKDHLSMVHMATHHEDVEILRLLAKHGADMDILEPSDIQSPQMPRIGGNNDWSCLMRSVVDDTIEMAKLLLELGASIDHQNSEGRTALMFVCELFGDSTSMAEFLIQTGADIDLQDRAGRTALMYAVHANKPNFAKKLLEAGADVNKIDNNRWSALSWSLITRIDILGGLLQSDPEQALEMKKVCENMTFHLIEHGADMDILDVQGRPIISNVIMCRKDDVAKFMLENGVDLEGDRGFWAFYMAGLTRNFKMADLMRRLNEVNTSVNMKGFLRGLERNAEREARNQ